MSIELERLKKLGLSSSAASGIPAPIVPPRQRHNPFNLMERESNAISNAKNVIKKQSFAEIHVEYGVAIQQARDLWMKNNQSRNNAAGSLIKEDVLITL